MTATDLSNAAEALVQRSTAAQALPITVADEAVLRSVAALLAGGGASCPSP